MNHRCQVDRGSGKQCRGDGVVIVARPLGHERGTRQSWSLTRAYLACEECARRIKAAAGRRGKG